MKVFKCEPRAVKWFLKRENPSPQTNELGKKGCLHVYSMTAAYIKLLRISGFR